MDSAVEQPENFKIDPLLFYDAIVKSTDDYIFIVDMATDMALVSENMVRDFDLPGRRFLGLVPTWGLLVHDKDKNGYYKSIADMLDGKTSEHNVEYQVRSRKGEYLWMACRGQLQRDENGTPVMFAGVVANMSTKGKVDYITGLFTQQECERRVNFLTEKREPMSILLLGLDDFTSINNLKDHIFGDAVLRAFAQEVLRMLPPDASMYRFDGDEFAIICPDAALPMAERLYEAIRAYSNCEHEVDGIRYYCAVSAGIAIMGRDCHDYAGLIKCASNALETSKKRGKNKHTIYTPDNLIPKMRGLEIASRLQSAVLNGMGGFHVTYQPLCRGDDMSVYGAEALLRWTHPLTGAVSAGEFVPLLETSGMIVPVGRWVLRQAVATCKQWLTYCPDFVININVSFLQFLDKDFVREVLAILEDEALPASHLVLELTESHFVTDMDLLKKSFRQLRSAGVRIAMDDFGTGYSSLGMLSHMPADIVKIDRMFIAQIGEVDHSFNRSFIGAVIRLCHSVGIQVCVEGVENERELKTVRGMEADCIQGFHIARPMLPDDFEECYLNAQKSAQPV